MNNQPTHRNAVFVAPLCLLASLALPVAWSAHAATSPSRATIVNSALNRILRERVSSPGGRLTLRVKPGARAAEGFFDEISVHARPAQVKKLRITELHLKATGVRLDVPSLLHESKVRTIYARTQLRAVVSQDDLTRRLAAGRHSKEMGLRVQYLPGLRMKVTGNWKWSWFNGPVEGIGRLQLARGHKVNLQVLSLKLNGAEVPAFVKEKFSERINPVIDYEDVPFRPNFKSIRVEGKYAVITA